MQEIEYTEQNNIRYCKLHNKSFLWYNNFMRIKGCKSRNKIIKENYKYIILLLLLIVFFSIFKKMNGFELLEPLDKFVEDLFQNTIGNKYTSLVHITSDIIGIYTLLLIIVCMIFKFKNKYYVTVQSICYSFTLLTLVISKNTICRIRPSMDVLATIDIYSFPSGHTLTAFVGYFFLAYILSLNSDQKTKNTYYFIASILVITVAFTRLYLNVHYCSDILGSILFGTIILRCLMNIVEKHYKKKLI